MGEKTTLKIILGFWIEQPLNAGAKDISLLIREVKGNHKNIQLIQKKAEREEMGNRIGGVGGEAK